LNTPDQARAGQFYSDLFGWQIVKEDEDPAHNYWHIKNGEEFIGGIPPASHHQPGVPAHWLAYFTVSDCDSTAAEAKKIGAKLYMPPRISRTSAAFPSSPIRKAPPSPSSKPPPAAPPARNLLTIAARRGLRFKGSGLIPKMPASITAT